MMGRSAGGESTPKNSAATDTVKRWLRASAAVVLCALLGLLFSAASLHADSQSALLYASSDVPLYAQASDHVAAARITPGTGLQPTGPASAGLQPVALEGWMQEGSATILFAAAGQRIVVARLADPSAQPRILSSTTDPYGNVWHETQLTGFVPATDLVADQETVWAAARALFSKRCSACHALHHTNEFTANQWPTILKTMTKNAALQPDQAELVTRYLQAHAKP
jgi:hypothetical protein